MRTTIRLKEHILLEAKRRAAETHRTLTEFIRDSVVAMLERELGWVSPRRVELPTFRGDGLFDEIDIDNSASLLNRVEIDQ